MYIDNIDPKGLLRRLTKELNEKAGMSQFQIGRLIGCSQSGVYKIMRSGYTNFEVGLRILITHYLYVVCEQSSNKEKEIVSPLKMELGQLLEQGAGGACEKANP